MEWQPIDSAPKQLKGPFGPWLLLCHKDKQWIRMGHFYTAVGRWYYSGTSERSQYGETQGDAPTHWMQLPHLPR